MRFGPRTGWFIERNSGFRYHSSNMRAFPILSAVLLSAATPVLAQVTVDLHALDALPNRSAPSQSTRPRPAPVPSPSTVVSRTAPPAAAPVVPPAQQPAMPE